MNRNTATSANSSLAAAPAPRVGSEGRSRVGIVPWLPGGILLAIILVAIAAPVLTPYSPVRNDLLHTSLPPAWLPRGGVEHLLGTDGFGRDVLTRLLYGARVSLSVAFLSMLIALTIGTTIGLTAGYLGGAVDTILMRFVDVTLSLPLILVALAVAVALGPSFTNLILVIGLMIWPRIARLIRGEVLVLNEQEYIRYARAIAIPGWLIVLRHALPNVLPTLLVLVTLEIGHVILIEATLSFLGAGMPPPEASWGTMISEGRAVLATAWWIALFAGLAAMCTVLAANMLGDWLRDYLDPRTKRG